MVSVLMFDAYKVYFDSVSALELMIHILFEICTNERLFRVYMWLCTMISSWQVEKIFI